MAKNVDYKLASPLGRMEIPTADPEKAFLDEQYELLMRKDRLDKYERKCYDKINQAFLKYSSQLTRLKTSITSNCIVTVAPVLPLADSFVSLTPGKHFDVRLIHKAGIPAVIVDKFIVLEDQFLLGINISNMGKSYSDIDEYKKNSKQYLDKIHKCRDKISKLTAIERQLDDFAAEKKDMEENNESDDDTFTKEARINRIAYIDKKSKELESLLQKYKTTYKKELDELDKIEDEYKQYKSTVRDLDKNGDFKEDVFKLAWKAVEELNEQLGPNDDLMFPEIHHQTMSPKARSNERPKPIILGNVAYFWVMKSRQLFRLVKAIGNKELKIKSWTFPNYEKSKILKKLDNEVQNTNDFVKEIIKIKRWGTNKENALKKIQVFLIKQHKELDDYYMEMFEKVWNDVEEIVKSEQSGAKKTTDQLIKIKNHVNN